MRIQDASKYEILYDLPAGQIDQKAVGSIRTKTIRAGDSLEIEAFPMVAIPDGAKREKRRRQTGKAQAALNLKNTRKRVRRLLEANFSEQDIALHLTFDYGVIDRAQSNLEDVRSELEAAGYPMDDEDARRILRNFIKRVRRLIAKRGGKGSDLKYLYVIETTREPELDDTNALPARYHYHMVLSGQPGDLTIKDMQGLWQYGYTKAEPLDMRFNGLAGLAAYITKQRRCVKRWAHSQNLREPTERISHRKISRGKAAKIARDVQGSGREILEKLYPGYGLEECEVRYSDFVAGAYIYARLRKRKDKKAGGGKRR